MTTLEILSVCNGLLLALLLFGAREFWSEHKKQHREMAAQIKQLAEIYASKSAMFRAHKRIDLLEMGQARHDQRLVRLETRLDLPEMPAARPGPGGGGGEDDAPWR